MPHHKILMCAPDHFGVDYVINPWMEGNKGNTDGVLAYQQWVALKLALEKHADLVFVSQKEGLPDQVFTANAGFVIGNQVVVSRFKRQQRQGEEPLFHDWFKASGFTIVDWPQDIAFEGAGDALIDRGQDIIWAGGGVRSDLAAAPLLEKIYKRRVLSLKLVDPRFYHLDTCLCPLDGGFLMYFPSAFDEASQKKIIDNVPESKRIAIEDADAMQFSCNAVDLDKYVFMNGASDALQDRLRQADFTPIITPLSEFMKAGGAAKCLTLKLREV